MYKLTYKENANSDLTHMGKTKKIKNAVIGAGLAVIMLTASIAPSTVKASDETTPAFDPDYYVNRYWDLKGMNADEAYNHFMKYGLKEGRSSSPVFDVKLYKELNWDLAGLTNEQAYNHFINYGRREGRRTSIAFDANFYAYSHWEGEMPVGSAFYNFPADGLQNGRSSSYVFDVDFYRHYNWDLRGMTNEEAYMHFLTYGIKEGRKTAAGFDVREYRDRYWDLANMSYEELYKHYILYGRYEGRNPNSLYNDTTDLTELVKSRYEDAMDIVFEIEAYGANSGNRVPRDFVDSRDLSHIFTEEGWESFKDYAGIAKWDDGSNTYECWIMQYVPSDASNIEIESEFRTLGGILYGTVYLTQEITTHDPTDRYRLFVYDIEFTQEYGRWLIHDVKEVATMVRPGYRSCS